MNPITTTALLACAIKLGTSRFRWDIDARPALTWEDTAYHDIYQQSDTDVPLAEVHGASKLPAELHESARAHELVAELVSVYGFTTSSQPAELQGAPASIELRGPLQVPVNNGQGYYEVPGDHDERE